MSKHKSNLMPGHWSASWAAYHPDPRHDLGVFAFRRAVVVDEAPGEFAIKVSADQRYKLYVNGEFIGFGPQRGDILHWHYETYDLAPMLHKGENCVVALVWNFGRWSPMAQHSARLGFILESPLDELDTPEGWQVAKLEGWDWRMMNNFSGWPYIDVGPGEDIHLAKIPVGLCAGADGALDWQPAYRCAGGTDRRASGGGEPWQLIPRSLPPMLYRLWEEAPVVRDMTSGAKSALVLPLELSDGQSVVLDYGELVCAYPRVGLQAEPGCALTVVYAENAYGGPGHKGHRDDVAGKSIQGIQDIFRPESSTRAVETLWWRTFRYIELTASGKVRIDSLEAVETGYPLQPESSFASDDPSVPKLWEVSVRTAQRCAGETYFDCPYYEQLQYLGDTRVQALIGYYLARDRALQRNAVENFAWSIIPDGLTQSRYPSRQPQMITTFSLWWVLMVYDQWMYDRVPLTSMRARQVRGVLAAWDELLESEPGHAWWCFADWHPAWNWGEAPLGHRSAIHRWALLWAKLAAARMFGEDTAGLQGEFASSVVQKDGLVGHVQDPDSRSEHQEALWRILLREFGMPVPGWPDAKLAEAKAIPCSYYFSYYKHLAMAPDDYMEVLRPWQEQIELGCSTFIENPEPVRSECHAWSAHPALGFFQHVAGVTSVAPGWKVARIEPKPGRMSRFGARIAHPDGWLRVGYEDGYLSVDSPVPFELIWRGQQARFEPGSHRL